MVLGERSYFEPPINLIDLGMYCCGSLHRFEIAALVDTGTSATLFLRSIPYLVQWKEEWSLGIGDFFFFLRNI